MDYSLHRVARMYVTDSPCLACAKAIINAGIKEVVFDRLYRDQSGLTLLQKASVDTKRVEVA
jgi:dCMP deaminase